jgi:AcrR family transcriptional regulator
LSPRTAAQVEQLKGERRRALLRAARKVYASKGLAGAKIGDVAAAAGISHGLVYHYFPEKESLFAAVVEETVTGWEVLMSQARKQPGTSWDRLVYICERMVTGLHEEPEHLMIIVQAFTGDAAPRAVRDALERYNRLVFEQLSAMIEEGQRAGLVAPGVPAELARVLLAIVKGLAISRVVTSGEPLPSLELVLRILKPGSGSQAAITGGEQ